MTRLKSNHWLDAYRSRLAADFIPFYVTRKGDMDAGAIYVRVDDARLYHPEFDYATSTRNWVVVAEGDGIGPYVERLEKIDPDFWLLDVEKDGERHLFTDGL